MQIDVEAQDKAAERLGIEAGAQVTEVGIFALAHACGLPQAQFAGTGAHVAGDEVVDPLAEREAGTFEAHAPMEAGTGMCIAAPGSPSTSTCVDSFAAETSSKELSLTEVVVGGA